MLSSAISLLLLCGGVFAAPAPDTTVEKRATCTPASLGNTQLDDTPAIAAAIKSCGKGGIILIPAGTTYSIRSSLLFTGCVNCDFQLEGTLKTSDDTTYWSTQTAIINLSNIAGAKIRSLLGKGLIDGNGQNAYDIFATDSSLARQTMIYVSGGSNIAVTGITMKNPPNVFVSQKGSVTNIAYSSLTLTAASKSTNLPKNTDGFDIGESTYTTIKNVHITNQDDCIAFKSGCNYVTVQDVTCSGSHGLSVGSLGKTNADSVKNVYVNGATMIDSTKAVGIKVYPGGSSHGTATVSNVTWTGIVVQNCDYAAQIQSCYGGTAAECSSSPSKAVLSDIHFENFSGTTSKKYSPVVSNLNCPPSGTCDIHFSNYLVKNPSGTQTNQCLNIDSSPGITCVTGASG